MTKILWHSNGPHVQTGYGSQTALFAPRIRDLGHDVAISAFFGVQGGITKWNGMTVYPSGGDYGTRWVPIYAAHHAGTKDPRDALVLTLMDVWALPKKEVWRGLKAASWVPVDHVPAPPIVASFFQRSGAVPIAMSRFGEQQLQIAGFDPLYVPHGVDTSLLLPRDNPREPLRELPASSLPDDAFVVGMVAANIGTVLPRKAFPQVFQAFAELHRRHPDTLLYLHAYLGPDIGGLDLAMLANVCGIPADALRFTPELSLQLGFPYVEMSWVYSAFDVLINPSFGEGFGIPIVEAQACGTPVIVNDFSAMPELVGAGWAVGGEPYYDPSQGAWFQAPHVTELVDALELAYQAKGTAAELERRQEAVALAARYDVKTVTERYWRPALALVEQRLTEADDVPPVAFLNREQRRKAARRSARDASKN